MGELGPSPSHGAALAQQERLLLHALRSLTPNQQLVMELSLFEELSRSAMAELLQVPEGTVASRVRRARSALERALHRLAGSPTVAESTVDGLGPWAARVRGHLEAFARPTGETLA